MDNEILSSQPVENPVPTANENNKEKMIYSSRTLLLIIFVIISVTAIIISRPYFFTGKQEKTNISKTNTEKSLSPTFQTIAFSGIDLDDSDTLFFFADAKKLYKSGLDGSGIQEIAAFPYYVGNVDVLKNGNLVIGTFLGNETRFYLVKKDTYEIEEIDDAKYNHIFNRPSNTDEQVYTLQLDNGQAEIWSEKFDGSTPVKIGLLTEKLLNIQICDIGENCTEKQHPSEFIPSLSGSYLLNNPPSGGGIGSPAIVVSRDGSRVYKIDFFWYVSSAVWLADDILLTIGQEGKGQEAKQKLTIFYQDGTFKELPFAPVINADFFQKGLSPTAQFLVLQRYSDPVEISLLDLTGNKIITVEKEDREGLIKQYSLADEIAVDPRIDHIYGFIGWNKKGDKFIYSEQISPFVNSDKNNPTEIRKIKIYDLNLNKSFTLVDLNPHPANPDEFLVEGKPVSNIFQFGIY